MLTDDVKKRVWERDEYRCQECGIPVGRGRGLRPQTHHKIRPAAEGSDDPDNLITLCIMCHATKNSRGHRSISQEVAEELYTQYVPWCLRELAVDTLAYSESLDARVLPTKELLRVLGTIIKTLEMVQTRLQTLPFSAEGKRLDPPPFSDIVRGLEIAWKSHLTQHHLDELLSCG